MNKKRVSQKQEKSVAKEMNAKTVVASGAFWGNKADVRGSDLLIECKTTGNDYYNITSKVWEKIATEAVRDRLKIPLLMVDLRNEDRYVIFNPQDFENKFFEYEIGNSSKECKKQFKFKGYTKYGVPIAFFIKPETMDWKESICLMAMRNEEFHKYYMEENNGFK